MCPVPSASRPVHGVVPSGAKRSIVSTYVNTRLFDAGLATVALGAGVRAMLNLWIRGWKFVVP
jgi:hypothetical protein